MTRKERIDWLCRLRSNIYYMPNKWHEKMECALSEAIDREGNDIIDRVLEIIDEEQKEYNMAYEALANVYNRVMALKGEWDEDWG